MSFLLLGRCCSGVLGLRRPGRLNLGHLLLVAWRVWGRGGWGVRDGRGSGGVTGVYRGSGSGVVAGVWVGRGSG